MFLVQKYNFYSILPLGTHGVLQEVLVGEADAVFEFGLVGPAQFRCFAHVQELATSSLH